MLLNYLTDEYSATVAALQNAWSWETTSPAPRPGTMYSRASFIRNSCRKSSVFGILKQPRHQFLHATPPLIYPRRKDFFSSNATLRQKQTQDTPGTELPPENSKQKKKAGRSPVAKTSLRRVAVEAQRSRDGILSKTRPSEERPFVTKVLIFYLRGDFICVVLTDS